MNRDEAITLITETMIKDLSKDKLKEILTDWWGIEQDHPDYNKLSDTLRSELLQFDEPQKDVLDVDYNALLLVALRQKYIGTSNEYLSKRVSAILYSIQEVVGVQEELNRCPCCEFKTLPTKGEYDICRVCFWEDDGSTEPSYYSPPNHMTLAQAREHFVEFGGVSESSLQFLEVDRLEMFSK